MTKNISNFTIRNSSSGLHIFNRSTGLNILFDEIQTPQNLWASAPRQVSIALTNYCDLKCPFCYAPKQPAALELELLKDWLIELNNNGCLGIGLGGGEPCLYDELSELCTYIKNNTNLAVVITTHAHLLSDKLLCNLSSKVNFIRVSMDGVWKTYESLRGRSFKMLLKRIESISQVSNFGINYLVNSRTIGDIDSAIDIAQNFGASEFLLIPEVQVGKGKGIDRGTKSILREWIYQYCGRIRLSISELDAENLPVCNPFRNEVAISSFAHIDASNYVKQTSYHTKGIHIGSDGLISALDKLKILIKEKN